MYLCPDLTRFISIYTSTKQRVSMIFLIYNVSLLWNSHKTTDRPQNRSSFISILSADDTIITQFKNNTIWMVRRTNGSWVLLGQSGDSTHVAITVSTFSFIRAQAHSSCIALRPQPWGQTVITNSLVDSPRLHMSWTLSLSKWN